MAATRAALFYVLLALGFIFTLRSVVYLDSPMQAAEHHKHFASSLRRPPVEHEWSHIEVPDVPAPLPPRPAWIAPTADDTIRGATGPLSMPQTGMAPLQPPGGAPTPTPAPAPAPALGPAARAVSDAANADEDVYDDDDAGGEPEQQQGAGFEATPDWAVGTDMDSDRRVPTARAAPVPTVRVKPTPTPTPPPPQPAAWPDDDANTVQRRTPHPGAARAPSFPPPPPTPQPQPLPLPQPLPPRRNHQPMVGGTPTKDVWGEEDEDIADIGNKNVRPQPRAPAPERADAAAMMLPGGDAGRRGDGGSGDDDFTPRRRAAPSPPRLRGRNQRRDIEDIEDIEDIDVARPELGTDLENGGEAATGRQYAGRALVFTMDSIVSYVSNAKHGGPAGEIVVRKCLTHALNAMGIQVDVATSDNEFFRLAKGIADYNLIFLDEWTVVDKTHKPRSFLKGLEDRVFLLSFFGTCAQ